MFGSITARLPRLGTWPRVALIACCVVLALDSAVTSRSAGAATHGSVPVVVATRALSTGHVLRAGDMHLEQWPRSATVGADLHRAADAAGRRLSTPLARGEPVSSTRLVGRDLATGLPPGQVVTAVQVADPRAGDLVRAGDTVEFCSVPRTADGLPAGQASTNDATGSDPAIIAGGVRVLAVLPAADQDGAEIVVAAASATAARLASAAAAQLIDVFGEPP